MIDIAKRYDEIKKEIGRRAGTGSQTAATLVLASVVQEVGGAIIKSLNQVPTELKYELARYLAEQIPVRGL